MTQTSAQFQIVDEWTATMHPSRKITGQRRRKIGQPHRPGLLARLVAGVLAANARYCDTRRVDRMCDRMRADIGLPPKGAEARRLERQIEEMKRWC